MDGRGVVCRWFDGCWCFDGRARCFDGRGRSLRASPRRGLGLGFFNGLGGGTLPQTLEWSHCDVLVVSVTGDGEEDGDGEAWVRETRVQRTVRGQAQFRNEG